MKLTRDRRLYLEMRYGWPKRIWRKMPIILPLVVGGVVAWMWSVYRG
jgi:hypothetical protein